MSVTLHLVCLTCNEELWVGQYPQGAPENAVIYTAAPDLHLKAGRFYMKHLGHSLYACDDHGLDRMGDVKSFEEPDDD